MSVVRVLRDTAGLTQAELAELAGTSQPTIAAYEAGRKSPTLRTLRRLAQSAGQSAVISFVPALTREDRRSLFLHRAIADKLRQSPLAVLARARRNATHMLEMHPAASELLEEWVAILRAPVGAIIAVMTDPSLRARELRQVTPFAAVLSPSERARTYGEFARSEATR